MKRFWGEHEEEFGRTVSKYEAVSSGIRFCFEWSRHQSRFSKGVKTPW